MHAYDMYQESLFSKGSQRFYKIVCYCSKHFVKVLFAIGRKELAGIILLTSVLRRFANIYARQATGLRLKNPENALLLRLPEVSLSSSANGEECSHTVSALSRRGGTEYVIVAVHAVTTG